MRKIILPIIVVATVLAGSFQAAGEAMAKTRFGITPLVKVSSKWDSNFFRTRDNEDEVLTYLLQPGLTLDLKTPRSYLSLAYTLDSHTFEKVDSNRDLDFIGHTLDASLGSQSRSGKLKFTLAESYRLTRSPEYIDPLTDSVSRRKYSVNNLSPKLEFQAGLAIIKLGYENMLIDYSDNIGEDSTRNSGSAELAAKMGRTSTLGVQFIYSKMDYDKTTTDYTDKKAKAAYGLQGKNLTITCGLGWMWRDFDNNNTAAAGNMDKLDDFAGDLRLTWQPGSTTLGLSADYGFNAVQTESSYYEATKVGFDLGHKFPTELTIGLQGLFQNNDYQFRDRQDDSWQLSASLGIPLTRWLDFNANGGYQERDSNLDNHDYENTYAQVGLTFKYPIGPGAGSGK